MLDAEIMDFIAQRARAGQAELAQTVRMLVQRRAPLCFDCLNQRADKIFLQPATFAWLTTRRTDINPYQVFFAALPLDQRPSRLSVAANGRGRAHLPGHGYVAGLVPNATAWIDYRQADGAFFAQGRKLRFEPAHYLGSRPMEFTCEPDTIVQPIFCWNGTEVACDTVEAEPAQTLCAAALERLAHSQSKIYSLLRITNRRIHIYRSSELNSFASLSAHGAAFLNVPDNPSEVFFLDDFAHQGGHGVFNAATLDNGRYLRCDANTSLHDLGVDPADTRSVYAAFHGLFTYSMILSVLGTYLLSDDPQGRIGHELRGRIAFYLLKFRIDLQNLAQPRLFKADGEYLYQGFLACYEKVLRECHREVQGLDLSNQGYVFDYDRFALLHRHAAAQA